MDEAVGIEGMDGRMLQDGAPDDEDGSGCEPTARATPRSPARSNGHDTGPILSGEFWAFYGGRPRNRDGLRSKWPPGLGHHGLDPRVAFCALGRGGARRSPGRSRSDGRCPQACPWCHPRVFGWRGRLTRRTCPPFWAGVERPVSAAERSRIVFGTSLCAPSRLRPLRITRCPSERGIGRRVPCSGSPRAQMRGEPMPRSE